MTLIDQELLNELKNTWGDIVEPLQQRIDDLEIHMEKASLDGRAPGRERTAKADELLTREAKFADLIRAKRGGGDREAPGAEVRFGAMVAAMTPSRGVKELLRPAEMKALAEGINPSGGWVVPEELSGQVIDLARNKTRVLQAGAMTLGMGTDVTHIPKLEAGVTGAWKAENAPVSDEDPQFGRVTLTAKTCAVLVKLSMELFEDIQPESFALIEEDIVKALALRLDYAALRGQALPDTDAMLEPAGIAATAGINTVSLGADGATPTDYDWLIDGIGSVWDANGEPNAVIYSSRTARTMAKLKNTLNDQLRPPVEVEALERLVSNQIPNDLTVGTSNDCSEAYVGDFSQLIIGVRPTLGARVIQLPHAFADHLQFGLVAYLRADVAVRHPEHFTLVKGIRP